MKSDYNSTKSISILFVTQKIVPPRQFLKINIDTTGLLLWNDD